MHRLSFQSLLHRGVVEGATLYIFISKDIYIFFSLSLYIYIYREREREKVKNKEILREKFNMNESRRFNVSVSINHHQGLEKMLSSVVRSPMHT